MIDNHYCINIEGFSNNGSDGNTISNNTLNGVNAGVRDYGICIDAYSSNNVGANNTPLNCGINIDDTGTNNNIN